MKSVFKEAWGYQGDAMNLPVGDVESSAAWYEKHFGFRIESRSNEEHPAAVLSRDSVRIRLAENGGDPTQDGVAFEIDDIEALREEFKTSGLEKISEPKIENRDDGSQWKAFFVVSPDGLCFWLGERIN